MIELRQLVGRDDPGVVFDVDAVYHVAEDGTSQKVGYVGRHEGATFQPIVRRADSVMEQIVAELNEARERQGKFGPAFGPGAQTLPTEEALREYDEQQLEEDDD